MTTTIKFFGGDLGDIVAFFRCDLSQAASPIQQWDEDSECWVSTQYQCADACHRTERMADLCMGLIASAIEVSFDDLECEWEVVTGFIEDADTSHEDARDWYDSYGWHLPTDNAGDVCLQAVEYDWLDSDDDEAIENLMAWDSNITSREAAAIVGKAREIRTEAETIEALLAEAVEAYEQGDYEACVKALDEAKSMEVEHGDCPASDALRGQLIDDSVCAVLA